MNDLFKYCKPALIHGEETNSLNGYDLSKKRGKMVKYPKIVHSYGFGIEVLVSCLKTKLWITGLFLSMVAVSLGQNFNRSRHDSNLNNYGIHQLLRHTDLDVNLGLSSQTNRKKDRFSWLTDYFKPDLGFYYQWNGSKVSHTISIDIQNVADSFSLDGFVFHEKSGELEKSNPLRLTSFINYRLKF
ncbi:hypothetical protein [Allomuricauda sp. SCSIO 65647]|uniref:hypothetical protein n=1 Tax=Allomuricauda sp. SCSIO 65647 TaxID=2908843 RepID=UPI001F1AA571|nr:hypothetical protein [Muricauda sp. SCSIO 65647]UJH66403.1 hypothetical protein L0P89_10530 [Muricauda sp. SCSIO 65647]